jgi:2-oxoglutarate ferredoxin oxidoreductase subunit gamma
MTAEITEITGLRLAGFGGQGVVLAGLILGQAAINDGLFAAGANSYGAQARGSACKADVVISPVTIDYPHVDKASLLVAMSQDAYDTFVDTVQNDGRILYDSGLVERLSGKKPEHGLAVTDLSVTELKSQQVANVVWVGVVAGATGWFSQKAIENAAKQHIPERFYELNKKALNKGLELGRELKEF